MAVCLPLMIIHSPLSLASAAVSADGAGKGYNIVWAVILGTGVGSGISAFHHIISWVENIMTLKHQDLSLQNSLIAQ